MKGTEHRDAMAAIDQVLGLKHYRPETANKAVGSILAYMGARRLARACDVGSDERLVTMLAQVEDGASRLEQIPQRVEQANARSQVWGEICAGLTYVRVLLEAERRVLRGEVDEVLGTAKTA